MDPFNTEAPSVTILTGGKGWMLTMWTHSILRLRQLQYYLGVKAGVNHVDPFNTEAPSVTILTGGKGWC